MPSRRAILLGGVASLVSLPAWAQCIRDGGDPNIPTCRGMIGVPGIPNPSLDLSLLAGPLDGRITFTRASTATYFDAAGVLQTATANTPRFDADPVTHAPRGLLIEEARTNLLLNSATLGTQSVTTTAVATTLSFYGTGTVTLTGTFSGSLVGAGAFPARNALTFTPTAGTLTATVTGSVLDAQIEAGAFATSYIPTTGSTATRAVDVASMPTAAWFNSAAGTLATEWAIARSVEASRFAGITQLDDGSNTNRINLTTWTGTSSLRVFAAPSTPAPTIVFGNWTANALTKAAFTYAGINVTGTQGGAVIQSATMAGGSVGINRLKFGGSAAAGDELDGWVSRVRYWPSVLTAAQLQQITT